MRFIVLSIILLFCNAVSAQKTVYTKEYKASESFYKEAMPKINIRHVNWIKASAIKVNQQKLSEAQIKTLATNYGNTQQLGVNDVNALLTLVLQESYYTNTEDIKMYAEKVKFLSEQKQELREWLNILATEPTTVTRYQLNEINVLLLDSVVKENSVTKPTYKNSNSRVLIKSAKVNSDRQLITQPVSEQEIHKSMAKLEAKIKTLDEMGSLQSLNLQQAMQQQNRIYTMLSNIMKQRHDTQKAMINNLRG